MAARLKDEFLKYSLLRNVRLSLNFEQFQALYFFAESFPDRIC